MPSRDLWIFSTCSLQNTTGLWLHTQWTVIGLLCGVHSFIPSPGTYPCSLSRIKEKMRAQDRSGFLPLLSFLSVEGRCWASHTEDKSFEGKQSRRGGRRTWDLLLDCKQFRCCTTDGPRGHSCHCLASPQVITQSEQKVNVYSSCHAHSQCMGSFSVL